MSSTRTLKIALLFAIGLLASCARAEVEESVDIKPYTAVHQAGQSLLQALNKASPVRWEGRVYHGYTQWHVRWQFYWDSTPDGRCRIARNQTRLDATITLPALETDNPVIRQRFAAYRAALRRHELGHLAIARETAQEIDAGILSLPAMSSCIALARKANALGHRQIEAAKDRERAYDRETGYGRTQGAWLSR